MDSSGGDIPNVDETVAAIPDCDNGDKKTRARETEGAIWTLEPHVCRHCFGRLVSAPALGGGHWFLCTNCGARGDGETAAALCCCGLVLRSPVPGAPGTDAGIRCQPNPDPTPEFPSLFVAAEVRL